MLEEHIRQKWLDWDIRREYFLKMKKGKITKEQFQMAVEALRKAHVQKLSDIFCE